jgi:hypothetical protein
MNYSYPNPWDISNKDKNLSSPVGDYRIEYGELSEVAMGAPLGGECFLVNPNNLKMKLIDRAGGPVVWEPRGKKVAFPVWTGERKQKIAVVDLDLNTLTIYSSTFRVLDLKSFENYVVKGLDSPLHMTTQIIFDTSQEKVDKVNHLK